MATEIRQRPKTRTRPNLELIGLRINKGLSREQLGARIGVSRETVRLVECGAVPGVRVQYALAREFGRTPLELWPLDRQKMGR